MSDDALRCQAEAVYHGIDLRELADAPIIDCVTSCPACGHGEAEIIADADTTGFVERCCRCGHQYVDPTP